MFDTIVCYLTLINPILFLVCTIIWVDLNRKARLSFLELHIRMNTIENWKVNEINFRRADIESNII